MQANLLDSILLRTLQHAEQVVNVGVDISVRKEAEEVKGRVLGCHLRDTLPPYAPFSEHLPTLQRHIDQLSPWATTRPQPMQL